MRGEADGSASLLGEELVGMKERPIYAKKPDYNWESNCWVWVIEFKRIGDAK